MRMIYKKARSLFVGSLRVEADERIQTKIQNLESYKNAQCIMVYLATKEEVSTNTLITSALSEGKRIIVPYCKKNNAIGLAQINSLSDVEIGAYGIREPKEEQRDNVCSTDIDLVIVPGVCFDKECQRLGMGKGYYDRFLEQIRSHSTFIAPAFDLQITNYIPTEKHDLPVDMVVTEKAIYRRTL